MEENITNAYSRCGVEYYELINGSWNPDYEYFIFNCVMHYAGHGSYACVAAREQAYYECMSGDE